MPELQEIVWLTPEYVARNDRVMRWAEDIMRSGLPRQQQLPDEDVPTVIVRVTGSAVAVTTTPTPGVPTTTAAPTTTAPGATTTTRSPDDVYPATVVWRDLSKITPVSLESRWPSIGDAVYVQSLMGKSLKIGGQYHGWFGGSYDGRSVVFVEDGPCPAPVVPAGWTLYPAVCELDFTERQCDTDGNPVKRTVRFYLSDPAPMAVSPWVADTDPAPSPP